MSGGSYDYLCTRVRSLEEQRNQLGAMAERLEELPYASRAAGDTRRVLALLDAANALADKLAEVWHDVEWWDSGDYGEDQVERECRAYGRDRAPVLGPVMTEAEFQEAVIELAKTYGWRVYHVPDSRRATDRGFPDLALLHKVQGRAIFAELKSAKGKLTKDQMFWLAGLQAAGAEVAVWRPEHLERVIPKALQPRRAVKRQPEEI